MIEAFKQSYLDLSAFASSVDFIRMERVSPLLKLAQKAKPLSGINALNLTDVSQNRTQKIISTMKRIVDP
ncbi:MAG: hypothetical protein GXN97_06410 [Aquificae bacterium]|nr:hypothetical protein [Aquificota bacterium]